MRTLTFLLILLLANTISAQDYSQLGKHVNYSDTYRQAKKVKNIDKALLHPEEILDLELRVGFEGMNYQKFIDNQSKFIHLRKLVLDNCYQVELKSFPDLSLFKELEHLQIFNIPGTNLDKLSSLTDLKYIEIDGGKISSFPMSILSLKKLECLNLSVGYLTTLPDNISELTSLKELELTNNCFDEIPKQISGLNELLYLTINNAETAGAFMNGNLFCKNALTVYPSVFAECKKLKEVSLFKVKIDKAEKVKLRAEFKTIKFDF